MSRPVITPSEWTGSASHDSSAGRPATGMGVPSQVAAGDPRAGVAAEQAGPGPDPSLTSRTVWLEARLTAPHEARDLVRSMASEWGVTNPTLDDAVSIASELVTNAVVHAHTRLQLSLDLAASHLTIRVANSFPRPRQGERTPSRAEPADHGVGLWIVDHLADSWGTLNTRESKAVWASLSLRLP